MRLVHSDPRSLPNACAYTGLRCFTNVCRYRPCGSIISTMADDTPLSLIVEFAEVLAKFLFYLLQAMVLAFVPASVRRKDVTGQVVLITGAGKLTDAVNTYKILGPCTVLGSPDDSNSIDTLFTLKFVPEQFI